MGIHSEIREFWVDRMLNHALLQAQTYKRDPEHTIGCLKFMSLTATLYEAYRILIENKDIKPIEQLPEAEKRKLYELSKPLTKSVKQRKLICKAIYLLDKISE
jgi:hypothetical protein